jgi:hypothetical protein
MFLSSFIRLKQPGGCWCRRVASTGTVALLPRAARARQTGVRPRILVQDLGNGSAGPIPTGVSGCRSRRGARGRGPVPS